MWNLRLVERVYPPGAENNGLGMERFTVGYKTLDVKVIGFDLQHVGMVYPQRPILPPWRAAGFCAKYEGKKKGTIEYQEPLQKAILRIMLHDHLLFSILVTVQTPAYAGGITLELNVPECSRASVEKQANCVDIQNLRKPHRKRKSLIVQGEFGKIIDVVRKIMLFRRISGKCQIIEVMPVGEEMKSFLILILFIFAIACVSNGLFAAEPRLREIIVSHADENYILQLYHIKEDGSSRRKITNSNHGCRMPAVSPDGSKIVYVQQSGKGMDLWISNIDGKNPKALTESGRNLLPSWLPDSKRIVWMIFKPGKDPAENSQLHIMNTKTMESRRLFSDPQQIKFSNSMPVVSPKGAKVAFVSNRSGSYRVWLSNLDGSDAKPISPTSAEHDETLKLPIEQKVPAWSPDGKWIAHWEGVEMIHMSKFTGKQNRERDKLIGETWNVWVVGSGGNNKRKAGHGDDPTWSPDGFVTRAFPCPKKGGPKIMVETKSWWEELPILPPKTHRYGRFAWIPQKAQRTTSKGGGNQRGIFEDRLND